MHSTKQSCCGDSKKLSELSSQQTSHLLARKLHSFAGKVFTLVFCIGKLYCRWLARAISPSKAASSPGTATMHTFHIEHGLTMGVPGWNEDHAVVRGLCDSGHYGRFLATTLSGSGHKEGDRFANKLACMQ
jgi:hypothetical protein